ncbi:MAG: hypothetical protein U0800_00610 [Isosphaeraceae bacterium]
MQAAWPPQGRLEVFQTSQDPPEAATRTTTILGLDLGQFKGVACTDDPVTADTRFAIVPTRPDALRDLLDAERPDLVVFEGSP